MNAPPQFDAIALNAVPDRILKDQLGVEAVICVFFKPLNPPGQRNALECFKNMRPRDAAKTIMITQGGGLVGFQLKPSSTDNLTIEEAYAAAQAIFDQLKVIGEDAALEVVEALTGIRDWWHEVEIAIREVVRFRLARRWLKNWTGLSTPTSSRSTAPEFA